MIAINSLSDFATKLINLNDEDILWEFFLHKYMGEQSYSEWKESLESKEVSVEEAEKIISNSFDILNSFEPS
ncbi:MAG TPA: hypothetical protein DCR76_02020 [Ruminococcaceae bacterium]|nr:hypothetical protein [Oscillospiraceae bacterium]